MAKAVRHFAPLAMATLLVAAAAAQEPRTAPPDRATTTSDARGSGPEFDAFVKHCLILSNQGEIAVAEFALQQSQSEQVQQFAKKMIDDHSKFVTALGGKARTTHREGADPTPNATATAELDAKIAPPLRKVAMVEEEIAKKCLQSTKQALGSKQGAEFDKCFFGAQVVAHRGMRDKLQVLQQHVSPELAQKLQEGLQTTEEHLAMAEQTLQRLESATARRPSPARQD